VPLEFEEVAMHDDGLHTSIVSKFPLYRKDGKLYALCGIGIDITDRKCVEVALRQSEERYRSIFENAVEGIFQTTLDGKYVAVNPALARMYGYDSPDDMIATITDIASQLYVDPGRRNEFIRLMQTQEEVSGFEALVYRKDGRSIWISENVLARRDQAGVLVGYEGTVEDITERKLAEERLHATLEEVRMLSGRLATVQEAERTRIARELHDELGVGLTCLKIDLSRLHTMEGEGAGAGGRKQAEDKIQSMIEQIDTTIVSVQRLVTELRPAVLDDLGLVAAIEWQCQDFQKRTGIPCTCVTSADDIAMERERATAIFRICQEALTNTARHAQATAVTIKLESRNDSLQLVVADNGVGIPDTKVSNRQSLGLLGMRERVALFGGEITIQGNPGIGTTVTAYLPQCLT
jgi:PAS domain S-box-containing protein